MPLPILFTCCSLKKVKLNNRPKVHIIWKKIYVFLFLLFAWIGSNTAYYWHPFISLFLSLTLSLSLSLSRLLSLFHTQSLCVLLSLYSQLQNTNFSLSHLTSEIITFSILNFEKITQKINLFVKYYLRPRKAVS